MYYAVIPSCFAEREGAEREGQAAITAFLAAVVELCTQSKNDWFRVYLIRKICTQHGVEFVQSLLKVEGMRWVFPEEVLQQVLLSDRRPCSVFFLSCHWEKSKSPYFHCSFLARFF